MTDAAVSRQTHPTWPHGRPGEPPAEVPRPARSVDRLAAIVRLAVAEDDSSGLVQAAAAELERPLGLVGVAGEPLAHAPDGSSGRRALAGARAVARRAVPGPPPGWRGVTIRPPDSRGAGPAGGAGRPGAAARLAGRDDRARRLAWGGAGRRCGPPGRRRRRVARPDPRPARRAAPASRASAG